MWQKLVWPSQKTRSTQSAHWTCAWQCDFRLQEDGHLGGGGEWKGKNVLRQHNNHGDEATQFFRKDNAAMSAMNDKCQIDTLR
jgi:hypothetical protein